MCSTVMKDITLKIDNETFLAAQLIHSRYPISHWDSLILASAREADCSVVYTEDLSHGQDFDGVKVINPFL